MINEIIANITDFSSYLTILVYTLAIFIFALFVWKFQKFLSMRDILKLNLSQYNKSQHPTRRKFFGSLLYFLEYIIILPGIVFLWFGILSMFFIVLSENQSIQQIMLVSACLVATIRLMSYFNEDLSKDLSSLFPFLILITFLLDPSFFSKELLLERFLSIPEAIPTVMTYIIFVMAIEALMRLLYLTVYQVWVE